MIKMYYIIRHRIRKHTDKNQTGTAVPVHHIRGLDIMTNAQNVTVVSAAVSPINALRLAVGEANVRAYGAEREYAIGLCNTLPVEWYLVEASDKTETTAPIHTEKSALYEVLKAAKHSNPSTVWARVRKYAKLHIKGEPVVVEGATDNATSPNRSLTLRMIEELTKLYKAGKNAEGMSAKESAAHTYIASALAALGIDISAL